VEKRFFVPDLSPEARHELRDLKVKVIFVAESPHTSEVEPEELAARRPLCGSAGRRWWSVLGDVLDANPSEDVSLSRLLDLCRRHGVVVMNAVQYPLDPKIAAAYAAADPALNLGFHKGPGELSFKKKKKTPELQSALSSLRARLSGPALEKAPVYCLGNDALWFVSEALGKDGARERIAGKLPHPSAWWRKGGVFKVIARKDLERIFKTLQC